MTSRGVRFRKANAVEVGRLAHAAVTELGGGPVILLDVLEKNWSAVVGAANARNTRPMSFDDGILTVAVASPVWMTQARFMKSSFIEKITSFLGVSGRDIRDIAFTLDTKR